MAAGGMVGESQSQLPAPVISQVTFAAPNVLVTGPVAKLRAGFLSAVSVVQTAGASPPPGRYYGRILFLPNAGDAASVIVSSGTVLWEGYITDTTPPSFPCFKTNEGDGLVLQVWGGTNAGAPDTFAILTLWDRGGNALLYLQPAFTGPGEIYTIVLAQPGAGKDYTDAPNAHIPVPAFVRHTLHGFGASLTTAAAAANRSFFMAVQNAGGVECKGSTIGSLVQTASLVWFYRAAKGSPMRDPAVADTVPVTPYTVNGVVPDGQHPAGFFYVFTTRQIQAGDQWSQGRLLIEEWAGPNP